MSLTFSDEELEEYFRLKNVVEEYLNKIIRYKRAEEYMLKEMK